MSRLISIPIVLAISLMIFGCGDFASSRQSTRLLRDTSVTDSNATTLGTIDSSTLEAFLLKSLLDDSTKTQFRNFYNGRNLHYAWFYGNIADEQALNFWNRQSTYISYSGDSSLYNPRLAAVMDPILTDSSRSPLPDSLLLTTELELTAQFYRFANKAYEGNSDLKLKDLGWYIPRKKINPFKLLDTLLTRKSLDNVEPVYPQYQRLKSALVKLYEVQQSGQWKMIGNGNNKMKEGAHDTMLISIKKTLALLGDYPDSDSSEVFGPKLTSAIRQFQSRNGISSTGIVTPLLISYLNISPQQLINKILINLERIRWVPAQPAGDFLLVNIPEYRLHVFQNGAELFGMKVVVGSNQHNTVIFTGNLQTIVFSPYWNVPSSILKAEILPAIAKNPSYLARHNMEWNNGNLRQKPGTSNSLGLVKFLFPNSYNIYLHDTPAKSLFGENARAFSHGCIRIAEPKKLAEWLLRNDAAWTTEKIVQAMSGGKEKYVTLKPSVPVFICYFTAWVSPDGLLNFRDDIYGHDKQMSTLLFAKN